MNLLREAVKRSPWTYQDIAVRANKHPSTVGNALRGNYPHRGANYLSKALRVALERLGFEVPERIQTL